MLGAAAASLLAVYLSLARPLPVTARDILAQTELASGAGVLRDVVSIANDTSAPLAAKVSIYGASAVMAPAERTRLDTLLEMLQRQHTPALPSAAPQAKLPVPQGARIDPEPDPLTSPSGHNGPNRRTSEQQSV